MAEEVFVAAPPALVVARMRAAETVSALFPGLRLRVLTDRGREGLRWTVEDPAPTVESPLGSVREGSAEIWLEPWGGGMIVHVYLRCPPTRSGRRRLWRRRESRGPGLRRVLWAVKDELEIGRAPGDPTVMEPDDRTTADWGQGTGE